MPFTQETFLNSSIRGFNGSVGWGSQATTVSVDLVDDVDNGDSFSPPAVGSAVNFSYSGWAFSGLIQSYSREFGQQGNPLYSIQLQDPRELLAGVQLILQDYSGGVYGMSNIYNVFGYLESLYGFGGAQSNESGIPWWLIRDAFYAMQLTTPLRFRGTSFLFDPFYGQNLLPNYYRIGGDSISLLDFVTNISEAISADYHISMIPYSSPSTTATYLIKTNLISRNYVLRENAINEFVEQTDGAVSKQSGYELSNEVMNRFVVGGKVNNMYFQDQDYTENNEDGNISTLYDDVILPYWGYDAFDNLIIGDGDFNGDTGHEYTFTIDGRPMYLQTGKSSLVNYKTDLAELQAIRAGKNSWESFLWIYNTVSTSIHYKKANNIGITDGKISDELMNVLLEAKTTGIIPMIPGVRAVSTKPGPSALESEEQIRQVNKIYNYLKKYATEFYGKKFMVRIPFVAGARVAETNDLKFSLNPTSTGYVEEQYWNQASGLGYMPYNPEKFTDSSNKLYAYAKFTDTNSEGEGDVFSSYAFDKLSPDSYILDQYPNLKLGKMRENLFVKCSVDPKPIFLNPVTLFSPRAVITLDGPVTSAVINTELAHTALFNELKIVLLEGTTVLTEASIDDWILSTGSATGYDALWKSRDADFKIPDMVAVPLESEILRYGPWYVSNGDGKVEFENDSSLVPWNYGGFTAMALAGNAKVQGALTSQQAHEMGSVEFPGIPTLSLGTALLSSGPIVTDISVSVGEGGVTTSYRMNTWTHQFGRLGKYNVERFAKLSKLTQEQRKAFRKLYGYAEPKVVFLADHSKDPLKEIAPSTAIAVGEMVVSGSGDSKVVTPSVVTMTSERVTKTMYSASYGGKAGMSMDGLYVPYTTKVDSTTDLPKFETPTAGASSPTITDLHPFGDDNVGLILPEAEEDELPDDLVDDGSSDMKGIAFRFPMICAGWGKDIVGATVPTGDNYKTRADTWKVGPLDARWHSDRKVWGLGGGGDFKVGKLNTNLFPLGSGNVTVYELSSSGFQSTSDTLWGQDWFLPSGSMLARNTQVGLSKSGNEWYITNAQRPC